MKWFKWVLAGIAVIGLIVAMFLYRMLSSPSLAPYANLQVPMGDPSSSQVRAEFLGTTTILFDDGKTGILIDGFLSRPSIWRMLTTKIGPDDKLIESALRKAGITHADAIFVAHSHHDHAMDAARVARKIGGTVYGSVSTRNVVLGDRLPPKRFVQFRDNESFAIGDFAVRVFQTPHSPGEAFPGTVGHPLVPPARVSDYREGGNYSFLIRRGKTSILVVPSGNFIPGKFKGVKADTVFLGIGGLGKQSDAFIDQYWQEVVQTVGAKVVIPVHWDDFTRSLEEPIRPSPYALDDFDRSMKALLGLAKEDGVQMRLPVAFRTFGVN